MSTDSSSNEEDSQEPAEGIKTGEKSKTGLAITTILFFGSIFSLIISAAFIPEVPRMFGFSLLALAVISGLITTFLIAVDKFLEAAGLSNGNNEE